MLGVSCLLLAALLGFAWLNMSKCLFSRLPIRPLENTSVYIVADVYMRLFTMVYIMPVFPLFVILTFQGIGVLYRFLMLFPLAFA